ncbi:MAG: bifunctional oligoribonuclease/PAP phosphatase NrnA [Candidatus Omnitrophota bacterium]
MNEIKAISKALRAHNDFLITSHINPEGDSIGSQIAMACLLRRLRKRYIIVDSDPVPASLRFILSGEKVAGQVRTNDRFKTIISVDCPLIKRTGTTEKYFPDAEFVINIDHHVSNARFGDAIWIEKDMSSCGEMLYHLYTGMGFKPDLKAALAMYVAIVTDTGRFSYDSTSALTHVVAADLIRCGVDPLAVGNQLNEKKSLADLKLLNDALETLEMHDDGRVAVMYTSRRQLRARGVGAESTDGFVNYARSVDSAQIAVFLLERPDKPGVVHVSFRSKGQVNVNHLAALFGGGGHPNAAGCRIDGGIPQVKKMILKQIGSFLDHKRPTGAERKSHGKSIA